MVITRKIEIFINGDKEEKKALCQKLYANRNAAIKVANMCASHLFALDNTMPYLSNKDKELITFLGVKGDKSTRQNATYVAASREFKGVADMGMISSVIQNVRKMYQDDKKDGGMWRKSLRSYKEDMPIPFQANRFIDMRFERIEGEEGNGKEVCRFSIIGIPFQMKFGTDRSNNRIIVKRILSGEYKMLTSSIQIKDSKTFLLLCANIPDKAHELIPDRKLYAFLGVMNPIVCYFSNKDVEDISGMKAYEIGTKDEFNYRRRQIQEKLRRCQIDNKYTSGGKGRKRKTQAIERFHNKEKNYIDTKLHLYSKILVDYAVSNKCSEIILMNQTHREEEAKRENKKGDNFVLRNWSYYGLKTKIEYKSKSNGIKLTIKK